MKILKWTTINEYVDIETGEIITNEQVKQEYIIIKKNRNVQINNSKQQGYIRYTNECRKRAKQLKAF